MMDDKGVVEEGEIHDEENDGNKDDKEDVPDNFFDDFNNEGFMESLQIVDSLDDTNTPDETEENESSKEEHQNLSASKSREKSTGRIKGKRSQEHEKKSRSIEKKYRNESPRRRRKFDNAALRRDPNKTKRDLERDRENFVKKKEQKVISKIVETGLVPPGMESEVNLNVIESENSKEVLKKDNSTKLDENETRLRDRRASKERRTNISKEKRRRSRSRSYGRYRSRSRSRGRRMERRRENRKSLEKRVISRSRDRSRDRCRPYERDLYSPTLNKRRRSRSGSVSDRERWLKERNRSPERKYQGMIQKKKMSFLEEIKMKLNGDTSSGGDMVTYPFPKNPVQPKFPDMSPMPVGSSLPQYNQNYLMSDHSVPPSLSSSYNEDFFIGNQRTGPLHPNVPPMHTNITTMQPNSVPMQPNLTPMHPNVTPLQSNGTIQMMPVKRLDQSVVENPRGKAYDSSLVPVPAPGSTTEISNRVSELMARISASTNSNHNKSTKSPQVEKQWTVTDFLSLNKPTEFSSDSEALRKKVDVLSRCQDFLKELSGDKQFSGKLKVMKSSHSQRDGKNISPLLRQKPIKFSFNAPMSENSYQDTLNRALIKLGVVSDIIDLVDDEEEKDRTLSAPAVKRNKAPFELKPETHKVSVSMKMCQTDPVKCEDCEKRKAVQYTSIGIQCGESERYNVGVQVVEEDINNYRIQKTQSLAYLTPAQLLGRSDPVTTRSDNFGVPSSDRPSQQAYRDSMNWNRPRDYYDDSGREYPGPSYYGPGRDAIRDPRYSRY